MRLPLFSTYFSSVEKPKLKNIFKEQLIIYFKNIKKGNINELESLKNSLISEFLKDAENSGYMFYFNEKNKDFRNVIIIKGCEIKTSFYFEYSNIGQGDTYEEAYKKYVSFNDDLFIEENLKRFKEFKSKAFLESVTPEFHIYNYNDESYRRFPMKNIKLNEVETKRFSQLIENYENLFYKELLQFSKRKKSYKKFLYCID